MDHTEIILSIRKVVRAIHIDNKRIQKECGLSIPQVLVLTYLKNKEDFECTQLEVRKYLHLNSSTVTGIVSRLAAKGYLAKLPAKGDKMATWLTLTASGSRAIDQAPPLFQAKLMDRLTQASEAEREKIKEGLSLLVEVMNIEDIAPKPLQ